MSRNTILIALCLLAVGFLGGIVFSRQFLAPRPPGTGSDAAPDGLPEGVTPSELLARAHGAAQAHPDDVEALSRLAGLYFKLGNYEEAAEWYGRVVVLDPTATEALLTRGYALWKLGKPEEAMDAFRLAARNAPGDYRAWYNIAVVLADLGRLGEASAALDRAARINPGFAGIEALRKDIEERQTGRRP